MVDSAIETAGLNKQLLLLFDLIWHNDLPSVCVPST